MTVPKYTYGKIDFFLQIVYELLKFQSCYLSTKLHVIVFSDKRTRVECEMYGNDWSVQ